MPLRLALVAAIQLVLTALGAGTALAAEGHKSEIDLVMPDLSQVSFLGIDGHTLLLTEANGRVVDSEAARQELRRRLGTDLPLANLRYWMLGVAAPGSDARVLPGERPPLRVIEQSGWRVGIDEFLSVGGFALPTRLTATTDQARIRVVVSEWALGPGAGPGQGP